MTSLSDIYNLVLTCHLATALRLDLRIILSHLLNVFENPGNLQNSVQFQFKLSN